MKRRIFVVVWIVCVLLLSTAYSARNPWTCPECAKTGNTGNYCGNCGHPAPDLVALTPGSTDASAVNTPASKATATPAPIRQFELNSDIVSDKGRVTVRWTDSENKMPYTVCFRYEDSNVYQPMYSIASDVMSQSYTLDCLIPGKTYKIMIIDANDQRTSRTYTIPAPDEFVDGKLKASSVKTGIEYRYNRVEDPESKARRISVLKASEIIRDRGVNNYGFRYTIDFPQLAYTRKYLTLIAVYAPNGYAESVLWTETEYGSQYDYAYWYMLGSDAFNMVYELNETVPTGTWTVELYWDGMFVNRSTFTVQ